MKKKEIPGVKEAHDTENRENIVQYTMEDIMNMKLM